MKEDLSQKVYCIHCGAIVQPGQSSCEICGWKKKRKNEREKRRIRPLEYYFADVSDLPIKKETTT